MKTEQIYICVVSLILGMLLLNTIKGVCGCDLVEGQECDRYGSAAQYLYCYNPDTGLKNCCNVVEASSRYCGDYEHHPEARCQVSINNVLSSWGLGSHACNYQTCMEGPTPEQRTTGGLHPVRGILMSRLQGGS